MSVIYKSKENVTVEDFVRVGSREVCKMLNLTPQSLWTYQQRPDFPKANYLGNKKSWLLVEIQGWLTDNLSSVPNHDNLGTSKAKVA